MKKIGRNDPCPCGSRRKYKKCCLMSGIKPSDNIVLPTGERIDTFSEELVIEELLRSSKEFRAFYEAERGKIKKPIFWTKAYSLPEGVNGGCRAFPTGEQVIELRRIPASAEDAENVAHELGHLVMRAEGFRGTDAKAEHLMISATLNSMINDPIVDSKLKAHGFKLAEKYRKELKESVRQISAFTDLPSEHYSRVVWIFNYTGYLLDAELMSDEMVKDFVEFQQWFERRFPEIGIEAGKLLAMIKAIGFDTPEHQSSLFLEIIHRYNLNGLVNI